MPDSPPTPDAQASQPEADELTKDLPGLPIETKHFRADERGILRKQGLFRRERFVPWAEVVGHGKVRKGWGIQTQRPDECEVHGVHLCAGWAGRRAIETAWREYVVRKIERDGRLCGTHTSGREFGGGKYVMAGGLGMLVGSIFAIRSALGPMTAADERLGQACGAIALAMFGMLCLSLGNTMRKIVRSALLDWYRWELSAEGLSHWSDDEKRVLIPSSTDSYRTLATSVNGVSVPLIMLTYTPMLVELLFAALARRGARPRGLGGLAVREMGALLLFCLTLLLSLIFRGGPVTLGQLPYGSLLQAFAIGGVSLLGALFVALTIYYKLESDKMLVTGRAMLERLGW